ncbi:U1 zinc finger [Colletotrichum orchidophilum]|uniref:U1 zinc finger n=1 Tax=Colletotrichum orchidophilum TaxID=1209926 RepID=A0A1G4B7S9_9PEZI|nr:U1 zinc finger [Colletotrichum orchidophilum]OHE97508.1 U1 zinc finger [Colletotrichum orchidophilum]
MSEYWKSTPKYWCKHCSIFVRDTKLERQNHEATGKHQGALKRFLRDLHRGHEQEEREKDRAKREVERLKGISSGTGPSSYSSSFSKPGSSGATSSTSTSAEAQRKQQMEQLAGMGVSIPTEFRGDMAMAGEWTVTATKVVDEAAEREKPVEAKAVGIRKREQTEEEREEEEAVRGLFKRPKKWGSTKTMPEDDEDLDALLNSNTLLRPVKKEEPDEPEVKTEESHAGGEMKQEGDAEDTTEAKPDVPAIKSEPTEDEAGKSLDVPALGEDSIKKEDEAAEPTEAAAPAVVFKKRKPKNIRQK